MVLNIKSENQPLFLQRMHKFCNYYFFNWLSDNDYAYKPVSEFKELFDALKNIRLANMNICTMLYMTY